jgi:hypothetical protein
MGVGWLAGWVGGGLAAGEDQEVEMGWSGGGNVSSGCRGRMGRELGDGAARVVGKGAMRISTLEFFVPCEAECQNGFPGLPVSIACNSVP